LGTKIPQENKSQSITQILRKLLERRLIFWHPSRIRRMLSTILRVALGKTNLDTEPYKSIKQQNIRTRFGGLEDGQVGLEHGVVDHLLLVGELSVRWKARRDVRG
jgi:hypothetical protein